MRDKITREEVKFYLSHPQREHQIWSELSNIKQKILDIEDEHSLLFSEVSVSLQTRRSYNAISVDGGSNKDLSDILVETEKKIEQYKKEYLTLFNNYSEELEVIKRINICLSLINYTSRLILIKKYQHNDTWYSLEHDKELNLSHRQLIAGIRDGIEAIVRLYNMDSSNIELARFKPKDAYIKAVQKRNADNINKHDYEQMNLYEYLKGNDNND